VIHVVIHIETTKSREGQSEKSNRQDKNGILTCTQPKRRQERREKK